MRGRTFALSQKELQRVSVISSCAKGDMACARAAELLSLRVRQVKRLKKRLGEQGGAALAHANRGRPSPRRLPSRVRQAALRPEKWTQRRLVSAEKFENRPLGPGNRKS